MGKKGWNMGQNLILCRFPLWINYQIPISFGSGLSGNIHDLGCPRRREPKECFGEITIIHFEEKVLKTKIPRVTKDLGFQQGDIWCLVSFLKELNRLLKEFPVLGNGQGILAPKRIVHDKEGIREAPFINVSYGEPWIDFASSSNGHWTPDWMLLGVKLTGKIREPKQRYKHICIDTYSTRFIK